MEIKQIWKPVWRFESIVKMALKSRSGKKKSGSTSPGLDASDALNGWAESLIWPDLLGSSRVLWTPLDASRGTA